MGNCNDISSENESAKEHHKFKLISRLQTKLRKRRQSSENFFLKYNKQNNTLVDISTVDGRRTVFVSLLGLYLTWKHIPSYMLYTSIFILPLKSKWIIDREQYSQEIQSTIISQLSPFSDSVKTDEFVELLKWKHSQGLLFCMLDEYKYPKNLNLNLVNRLVAPFWYCLSEKLTQLYDPISGKNYKPLNFDVGCMKNKDSKFSVTSASVLAELYFLKMEFKSLCEIIYQSNPLSLNPIQSYQCNDKNITWTNDNNVDNVDKMSYLLEEFDDDDGDKDNWWISEEYDPYDIDTGVI